MMHKQDPTSHRIIEKRRRDRMNSCLADLSQLIPLTYAKKFQSRGRIEKTEIIEMAIRHLKHLQAHNCNDQSQYKDSKAIQEDRLQQYRLGYQESMSESIRFLVEIEGLYSNSGACMRLVNHLQDHYGKAVQGLSFATTQPTVELQNRSEAEKMEVTDAPTTQLNFISEKPYMAYNADQHNKIVLENCHSDQHTKNQLCELLQNPDTPVQNHPNQIKNDVSTNDNTSGPNTVQFDNTNKTEDFYKFKKNIKERFTAGLVQDFVNPITSEKETVTSALYNNCCSQKTQQYDIAANKHAQQSCLPYTKKLQDNSETDLAFSNRMEDPLELKSTHNSHYSHSTGSSSGYNTDDSKYKNQSPRVSPSHSYESPSESSPEPSPPTNKNAPSLCITGTPIFALHPKGNFYIPLTVSASTVEPYVHAFDDCMPNLHPVSISVNFCYPGIRTNKSQLNYQNHHHNVQSCQSYFGECKT